MSGIMLACAAATAAGGTSADVSMLDQYVPDMLLPFGTASSAFQMTNAGALGAITSVSGTYSLGSWCSPGSAAGSYECLATLLSGSLTAGTTGSWLSLGTTRLWQKDLTYAGPSYSEREVSFNVAIRAIGTSTILATANVTLYCSVGVLP